MADGETEDSEFDEPELAVEHKHQPQKNVDLEHLVKQPTWKEMLLDLVVKEQLDPWNIDIGLIAEKYVKHIREMQTLDLHIPANLILAASILLRFKSDAVRLEEEEQVVPIAESPDPLQKFRGRRIDAPLSLHRLQ